MIDNAAERTKHNLSSSTDRFAGMLTTEDLIWQREVNHRFEKSLKEPAKVMTKNDTYADQKKVNYYIILSKHINIDKFPYIYYVYICIYVYS